MLFSGLARPRNPSDILDKDHYTLIQTNVEELKSQIRIDGTDMLQIMMAEEKDNKIIPGLSDEDINEIKAWVLP